jgi:hypothetical protein
MKKTVDCDYVSNREYNRNKRAAKARKNARRNRCILYCIVAIIVLMMALKIGGFMWKLNNVKLEVDHYVTYVVGSDDTLSGIASKFKMKGDKDYRFEMYQIMKENGITNENQIHYGQELQIPIYHYALVDDGQ